MGEFMHKHGAKIQKDEVRLSVKEIKALDFCRSVGWATSEEEIAEKCGMSETEAAWFNEKCIEGDLISFPDDENPQPVESLEQQIDKLAKYILADWEDKIIDGGAVEVAISIMKEYKNSKC